MELTRRDAIAALVASGVAVGGGAVLLESDDGDQSSAGSKAGLTDHERDTLVAVASVVYPTAVEERDEFVTTYLAGRASESQEYVAGASDAVARLDALGEEWHGGQFVDLDPDTRDTLLREVGADTAEPDPEGSPAERVRYYLVNELLYALYASPTGGKLVGIENPQGHPGGHASYQRGPRR